MNKYTKRKKPQTRKPTRTPFEIVRLANYLNLAVIVRTLHQVYGWRDKRIKAFLESYISLMQEVADKRSTVQGFIQDTKSLTEIDVKAILDEVYEGEAND